MVQNGIVTLMPTAAHCHYAVYHAHRYHIATQVGVARTPHGTHIDEDPGVPPGDMCRPIAEQLRCALEARTRCSNQVFAIARSITAPHGHVFTHTDLNVITARTQARSAA